jgi:hypothetical protein
VALDLRLRGSGGRGMLDLELAGAEPEVRKVLAGWKDRDDTARLFVALDTLFIPLATLFWWSTVHGITRRAARASRRGLAAAGRLITPLP